MSYIIVPNPSITIETKFFGFALNSYLVTSSQMFPALCLRLPRRLLSFRIAVSTRPPFPFLLFVWFLRLYFFCFLLAIYSFVPFWFIGRQSSSLNGGRGSFSRIFGLPLLLVALESVYNAFCLGHKTYPHSTTRASSLPHPVRLPPP